MEEYYKVPMRSKENPNAAADINQLSINAEWLKEKVEGLEVDQQSLATDLASKVSLTATETISGTKTFTSPIKINSNGSPPLVVDSNALVINLNADYIHGRQGGNEFNSIPFSNGNLNKKLNAELLNSYGVGNIVGYNAQATNIQSSASGKFDSNCAKFDGTGNIFLDSPVDNLIGCTVSFWLKKDPNPSAIEELFRFYQDDANYLIINVHTDNALEIINKIEGVPSYSIRTNVDVCKSNWQHICFKFTSQSQIKLFINGNDDPIIELNVSLVPLISPKIYLGGMTPKLKGEIDCFIFHDRIIDEEQLAGIKNNNLLSAPLFYYSFDGDLSEIVLDDAGIKIPVSNGVLNENLNADMVDGVHAGNANGNIPISNGILNTNLNADMVDGRDVETFLTEDDSKIPTSKVIINHVNEGLYFYNRFSRFKKGSEGEIIIPPFHFKLNGKGYISSNEIILTTTNLEIEDDFVFGSDYYIYIKEPASGNLLDLFITPSPDPNGIVIGGFHYGKIRNSITITDVSDGIVPNSVWDLKHMPKCYLKGLEDPSIYQIGGMAELPNGLWVDIYLASEGSGSDFNRRVFSKINQLPLTWTEGVSWYDFIIRGANVGKRMMSYPEWTIGAAGSPQGLDASNLHGWTKTTNTAKIKTGATLLADADANYILGYNTSLYNLRDCVGNVWEWTSSTSNRHDSSAWNYFNVLDVGENSSLTDFGRAYLPNANGAVAWIAGGGWGDGVVAGSRGLGASGRLWGVGTGNGCRFSCDPL